MSDSERIAVFSSSPLLTVTIGSGSDRPEVHLHAGGQGVWVAHLARRSGADVVFCCALGGEPGRVLDGLIKTVPLTLRTADAKTPNGVYVHDRRSGERVEVVAVESRQLARHASDELWDRAGGTGCGRDAAYGLPTPGCGPTLRYTAIGEQCGTNGKIVIADLTGPPLKATFAGGVQLLRLSEEELMRDHYATRAAHDEIVAAARALHDAGAREVVVASAPALLIEGGAVAADVELVGSKRSITAGTGDYVRRDGRRARPGHEHNGCASPRDGGRRAQRDAARAWHRHARRDRTSRLARDRQAKHHRPQRRSEHGGSELAAASPTYALARMSPRVRSRRARHRSLGLSISRDVGRASSAAPAPLMSTVTSAAATIAAA